LRAGYAALFSYQSLIPMKTISKYRFLGISAIPQPFIIALNLFVRFFDSTPRTLKAAIIPLCLMLTFNTANAQLGKSGKTADSMVYVFGGISKMFVQRTAFDQWTQTNFNITEPYAPSFYFEMGFLYHWFNFGFDANIGGAFQSAEAYLGVRLTHSRSFIGSWLNVGFGDFMDTYTNITPPTYTPVPPNQQLELHYRAFLISLTSKNYLNFLSYRARLGYGVVPVNIGFFVSVGWQPGSRNWEYGYFDADSVYHAQSIKPIPKLGKVEGTVGLFAGF
jgi:hypothetical protein